MVAPAMRVIADAPKTGRVTRGPQHSFSLKHRPWQIQPFLLAPVLPGETLKNLLIQSRVVSSPLKAPLVGWWVEYYFFYVKHRDLTSIWPTLQNMHVTNASTATIHDATPQAGLYHTTGGIPWVKHCLQRVTEEYFRDEEDGAWLTHHIDNIPLASLSKTTGLESLRSQADTPPTEDHEFPGEVDPLPYGVNAGTWQSHYDMWEGMRALKMTGASFEDWLRQWGVKTPEVQESEDKPELIRYIRQWEYPTNTVNPADGSPSTALSASVAERADKDRFFNEPGFVFGVTVIRPKVYLSKQVSCIADHMTDAFSWLPPQVAEQAWTSLRNFAFNAGPLNGAAASGGYWLDLRDLFVFGDQFVNYDIAADGTGSHVVLPDSSYKQRFATSGMADALFKVGAANTIRQDGNVKLSVLGRVVNQT